MSLLRKHSSRTAWETNATSVAPQPGDSTVPPLALVHDAREASPTKLAFLPNIPTAEVVDVSDDDNSSTSSTPRNLQPKSANGSSQHLRADSASPHQMKAQLSRTGSMKFDRSSRQGSAASGQGGGSGTLRSMGSFKGSFHRSPAASPTPQRTASSGPNPFAKKSSTGSRRGSDFNDTLSQVARAQLLGTASKAGKIFGDANRHPTCHPGRLVYSAEMDREKLNCLACLYGVCSDEKKAEIGNRTFVDVYTNGLNVNAPSACCCCAIKDNNTMHYWDDPRMANVEPAGCCQPYGCLCPHCCKCCGEAITIRQTCGCPIGLGHWTHRLLAILPICGTDVIAGLAEGEADQLVAHIIVSRQKFALDRKGKGNGSVTML